MKLSLKCCWFFYLLMVIQSNNCYAQISYEEMPDTLYQEYENERIVAPKPVGVMPRRYEIIPAKWKSTRKNISTKNIYLDCDDCVYQEYIDSLEIRSAYDKILVKSEIEYNYKVEKRDTEEWAWVKVYKKIPEYHKPCLDLVGIDTCLWKYRVIREAKYDTLLIKNYNYIPDTIKISPKIIPIKRYRLINKSKKEIEKLTFIGRESVFVECHMIEEKEWSREIASTGDMGGYVINIRYLTKAVTPLNYGD